MKKIGLMVVLALFAVMAFAPVSGATITRSVNGVGDALLFPFFNADQLNYVTITNESNNWIQVHVRLRTAAESIEGRDFPLILSPGDMSVFEVTRVGQPDGKWRISAAMDPHNFQYVLINANPYSTLYDIEEAGNLVNNYQLLESSNPAAETTVANEQYGYIEVIGEAVFDQGLDKTTLLSASGATNTVEYIKTAGNTLSDVPNVLSGKMYIMESEMGTGMAYNAIALSNFRTNSVRRHRVDNYAPDHGVILCSENSSINDSTADDYTYQFDNDLARGTAGGNYEAMISANNTWGPTFADGDDYIFPKTLDTNFGGIPTSVREVEAVFNQISVRGHYFNATNFQTQLVLTLPTKHHDIVNTSLLTGITTYEDYKDVYYGQMNALAPAYTAELWDMDESSVQGSTPFDVSPYIPGKLVPNVLPFEVNLMSPASSSPYSAGRFVLSSFSDSAGIIVNASKLPVIGLSYIDMGGKLGYMTETQY